MKQFRFVLDNSSRKYICPKCDKKTFVLYIDVETNQYLSWQYGRCDREIKCKYHHKPKQIISEKPIDTSISKISYHPFILTVESSHNFEENDFVKYLKRLFSENDVKKAISKYSIGTSKYWKGATVFWQIDNYLKVRAGKVFLYDSITGNRSKEKDGKSLITWAHRILKLKKYKLKQCLFGLHLVNKIIPWDDDFIDCDEEELNNKIIAIVESEKTAVIMSILKPELIWMATGSLKGFKHDMLLPIKSFKILAFPDKSAYSIWSKKAIELNKLGFKIIVNDYLEKLKYTEGSDLVDIFIEESKNQKGNPQDCIDVFSILENEINCEIKKKNELKYLVDTFQCNISVQRLSTKEVIEIEKLRSIKESKKSNTKKELIIKQKDNYPASSSAEKSIEV